MDKGIKEGLEAIDRARAKVKSKQRRFTESEATGLMTGLVTWLNSIDEKDSIPEWKPNSMPRDKELRKIWHHEPHLAGVINGVVSIDANRQWTLTGGRNQTLRFNNILRNAENGQGWREYMQKSALSFYTTDMGHISEIGRDGRNGPLRGLYHVDSALCSLRRDMNHPLRYHPKGYDAQDWRTEDFFRVASLPSDDEEYNGLGFCAVSRALLITELLIAVYRHDEEMLSAKMPRGLLLLQNISEQQWQDAMRSNEQGMISFEQQFFNNLAVIAQMGIDGMDAKLIPFSQLPSNFDLKVYTDLYMYALALCFGYDPIEFWPVSAGALGRGRETEIQHRKSLSKGAHAFTLGYQDRLQRQMPDTLLFEFEQRDVEGEVMEAELHKEWANVAAILTKTAKGAEGGDPILSIDEARTYLAERGVIPPDWTETEEDTQATAEGTTRLKERLMENHQIQRAIMAHPNEPIIQISWPTGKSRILWASGNEAMMRTRGYWGAPIDAKKRMEPEDLGDDSDVLHEDDELGFSITVEDVARAINQGAERVGDEFAEMLTADPVEDE